MMGWGCNKHEWDAESENWSACLDLLCDERLEKTGQADWGRAGQICPKCYKELEAKHDKAMKALKMAAEVLSHVDSEFMPDGVFDAHNAYADIQSVIASCEGEGDG